MPVAHGHGATRHRRIPSVQEMYNTWRALQEQVGKIARLPMFIQAELNFCHMCRILKRKCECFDYTQFEAVFQERNTALKEQALHQVPMPRATGPAVKRLQTLKAASAAEVTNKSEPEPIKKEFGFNNAVPIIKQPSARHGTPPTQDATGTASSGRQTVVLAREKIGASARRWRCMFGSGLPGSFVCKREDENMETIRRHYGREHGRHHYYKKPSLQAKCSACNYLLPPPSPKHKNKSRETQSTRPPTTCPACATPHTIWLREMTAVIDVPVDVPVDVPADSALSPLSPLSPLPLSSPESREPATPTSVAAMPSFLSDMPTAVSPLIHFSSDEISSGSGSGAYNAGLANLFALDTRQPASFSDSVPGMADYTLFMTDACTTMAGTENATENAALYTGTTPDMGMDMTAGITADITADMTADMTADIKADMAADLALTMTPADVPYFQLTVPSPPPANGQPLINVNFYGLS